MTVKREKPSSVDEIARVMRIFDLLGDEVRLRVLERANADYAARIGVDHVLPLLEIADRIAARTQG